MSVPFITPEQLIASFPAAALTKDEWSQVHAAVKSYEDAYPRNISKLWKEPASKFLQILAPLRLKASLNVLTWLDDAGWEYLATTLEPVLKCLRERIEIIPSPFTTSSQHWGFHNFNKLPFELRAMIWEIAMESATKPRNIEVFTEGSVTGEHKLLYMSQSSQPELLLWRAVCKETAKHLCSEGYQLFRGSDMNISNVGEGVFILHYRKDTMLFSNDAYSRIIFQMTFCPGTVPYTIFTHIHNLAIECDELKSRHCKDVQLLKRKVCSAPKGDTWALKNLIVVDNYCRLSHNAFNLVYGAAPGHPYVLLPDDSYIGNAHLGVVTADHWPVSLWNGIHVSHADILRLNFMKIRSVSVELARLRRDHCSEYIHQSMIQITRARMATMKREKMQRAIANQERIKTILAYQATVKVAKNNWEMQ